MTPAVKAIFLIKSPLQLLNAIEAREHFGYESRECLLLLLADRKSQPQLEGLIRAEGSWEHVFAVSDLPLCPNLNDLSEDYPSLGRAGLFRNDLFAAWKLRFLAPRLGSSERVFIGDMGNPLMRHFVNSFPNADAIILDDGTATLNHVSVRNGKVDRTDLTIRKKITLLLKRKLMGFNDRELGSVIFFSVFLLEVKFPDTYVQHNYPILRRSIAQIAREDMIYFLGSPLVEAAILSEDEFFQQLARVKEVLSGETVVYIAHRRELPERVGKIGSLFGWDTVLFDFPIEYQLGKVGPLPSQLTSFFSSALGNCKTIFGTALPIVSFQLDPKYFSRAESPKGRQVSNVYAHLSQLETDSFRVHLL